MNTARRLATSLTLALSVGPLAFANPAPETQALHQTLRELDTALFTSFNKCTDPKQLRKHASYFSRDVEFYHDNGGVTWSRDAMLANTKKYACGNYTRELMPASFKVSPIRGFGAVTTGSHRFCETRSGKCEGEADFMMVWRKVGAQWQVTRSVSYGHRTSTKAPVDTLPPDTAQAILQAHNVKGVSVALIRGGRLTFAAAHGWAKDGMPATTDTLYNIASLTKPITAEVALQLAARGQISLDEGMSSHWLDPDVANDPRHQKLTPRIALSHRTGFPNWRDGTLAFNFEPGSAFGYSGEGYEYLARYIKRKTQRTIDQWAEDLVFAPNAMRLTSYTQQAWFGDRVAVPHDETGQALKPQVTQTAIASDDVFSTPSDYAHFVVGVMQGRGLPADLAAQRVAVHSDRRADLCKSLAPSQCPSEAGMGLGWESFLINGRRYLMHTGSDLGTFTFVYLSPDSQNGTIIFTNSSNGSKAIVPILRALGQDKDFVDFLATLAGGG